MALICFSLAVVVVGIVRPSCCNRLATALTPRRIQQSLRRSRRPSRSHACLQEWRSVYEGDLGCPKRFECVYRLNDAGADFLASNPGLVLFAVHPTLLDDAEANVNNIDVIHLEACAGIRSSGEEAEDEGIKPVGGVPIVGGPHEGSRHFSHESKKKKGRQVPRHSPLLLPGK